MNINAFTLVLIISTFSSCTTTNSYFDENNLKSKHIDYSVLKAKRLNNRLTVKLSYKSKNKNIKLVMLNL